MNNCQHLEKSEVELINSQLDEFSSAADGLCDVMSIQSLKDNLEAAVAHGDWSGVVALGIILARAE